VLFIQYAAIEAQQLRHKEEQKIETKDEHAQTHFEHDADLAMAQSAKGGGTAKDHAALLDIELLLKELSDLKTKEDSDAKGAVLAEGGMAEQVARHIDHLQAIDANRPADVASLARMKASLMHHFGELASKDEASWTVEEGSSLSRIAAELTTRLKELTKRLKGRDSTNRAAGPLHAVGVTAEHHAAADMGGGAGLHAVGMAPSGEAAPLSLVPEMLQPATSDSAASTTGLQPHGLQPPDRLLSADSMLLLLLLGVLVVGAAVLGRAWAKRFVPSTEEASKERRASSRSVIRTRVSTRVSAVDGGSESVSGARRRSSAPLADAGV
jgi:hypothetical protein